MRISKKSDTANPAGSFRIVEATPPGTPSDYKREDFFRDLKKASRRVSEKPSPRDSKKR